VRAIGSLGLDHLTTPPRCSVGRTGESAHRTDALERKPDFDERTISRRASGCIVIMSIMSAQPSPRRRGGGVAERRSRRGLVAGQEVTKEAHLGWANLWDLGKERVKVRGYVMVTDWVKAMEMVNGRGWARALEWA
jgi:hypothetical protein